MSEKSRLLVLIGRLEADEKDIRPEAEASRCTCDAYPKGFSCPKCRIIVMLDLMQEIAIKEVSP